MHCDDDALVATIAPVADNPDRHARRRARAAGPSAESDTREINMAARRVVS
jgi:hypothetical protein